MNDANRAGAICLLLGTIIATAFGDSTQLSGLDPSEPLLPDGPGEPANAAAKVEWNEQTGALRLYYDGKLMFQGQAKGAKLSEVTTRQQQAVTQTLKLTGPGARLEGGVFASDEAIAAETKGAAQGKFPLVRTTIGGPSRNLRDNAIYDRQRDWLLAGATRIDPTSARQFQFAATGGVIELTFQPRFYQRHKNIAYFRPWTYQVRQDSITGWSSWWAYMRDFNQGDLDQLLAVWKEKHFAGYGYRFIQIDDCYQGGEHAQHHLLANNGYLGGAPATWLDWRKELFPSGLAGYTAAVKEAGFQPGVWIGSFFGDMDVARQHPDWFVRDTAGQPFVGPWIGYAIDASNPRAVDALVRPTYRGLKQAGVEYVKIDQLRHYLYDNLNHNLDYCRGRRATPAEILRDYLRAARQELGPNAFILACWGVLPETVGLADACRIGGDGYGPFTMQQYNSWNGIVWRNDPDHCDVYPRFSPAEAGNVTKTAAVASAPADTIIRPALASIAGCMLILSDKPAVYRDDANLQGLRRAAPVLFSVPGQLYDFDDSKTRNLLAMRRADITSGARPSPIDASQFGAVCPWWLNEFNRPFEHWNVLHRLNWLDTPADQTVLKFEDIGLDAGKAYLVYEFWSRKFLGAFRGSVELPAIKPMGLDSFAIREQLDRPQIVSTSRHLSQGGVDLVRAEWKGNVLGGASRVVAGDPYEIAVHVPPDFELRSAIIAGQAAEIAREGELARVSFVPATTGEIEWQIRFNNEKSREPRETHPLGAQRFASPGNTVYYVDPAAGQDANSGLQSNQPWRTFKPVNARRFAPGDHIEILAPGSFQETLRPMGAGTLQSPVEIHFARGRYDFFPTNALQLKLHISNDDDDPHTPKAIALLFKDTRHFRVTGDAADIYVHGKMIETMLDHADDVTFTGLSFDYDRPTVSELTVLEVAADHADVCVHRDSTYAIENEKLVWVGEGWRSAGLDLAQECDLADGRLWRRDSPLGGVTKAEELAPFRLRLFFSRNPGFTKGRVYQFRETFRDGAGVFVLRSQNIAWRDGAFRFMHGLGVVSQFSENLTFTRVAFAPRPGSGRTCAGWADLLHFSGCRGLIKIEDCQMAGSNDDPINVHGTHLRVVGRPGPHQLLLRFMHPQSYGFEAFTPGDDIELVSHVTLRSYHSNRVEAVEAKGEKEVLLTLARAVPEKIAENDVVENVT